MQLNCSLVASVAALNSLPVLVMGNKEAEVVESQAEAAGRLLVAVADLKLAEEEAVDHRVVAADLKLVAEEAVDHRVVVAADLRSAVEEALQVRRVVDRGSQRAEPDLQSQIHLHHSVVRTSDDSPV
jgi:hypothetical protein